ncbi:TetR family transcriptional regulator [Streptomyces sp. NPDC006265]|uniref:TetR/AcrR family transcriptional regulator n=1 Tax=Streptomyces sp. NPDC006265 TaxID=3156740 RepID=UPI0033BF6AB4
MPGRTARVGGRRRPVRRLYGLRRRFGTAAQSASGGLAARERQVLVAATEEFGRHGYESTTMAAVATRVGVTEPLLHHYFGSKQDLYLACLNPVGDRLLHAIRTAMTEPARAAPPTALRVLRALFTALGTGSARRGSSSTTPRCRQTATPPAVRRTTAAPSTTSPRPAPPTSCGGPDPATRWTPTPSPTRGAACAPHWSAGGSTTDQSPEAMTQRCARLFAAGRTILAAGDEIA